MRSALCIYTAIASLVASVPAFAWTPEEIGKAVAALDKVYQPLQEECSKGKTVRIVHETQAKDLNGDGVDEILVTTSTEPNLGCMGPDGKQLDLLVSDGAGGWSQMIYRYGSRFEFSQDPKSLWPILSVIASDMPTCTPRYHWDHGVYREQGFCDGDGNRVQQNIGLASFVDHFVTGAPSLQLSADAKPWTEYEGKPTSTDVAQAYPVPAPAADLKPSMNDAVSSAPTSKETAGTAAPAIQLPDYMTEIPGANIDIDRRAANGTWSNDEVVAALQGMNIESARSCAEEFKHTVSQTAELLDLNHDGIDEIVVGTTSYDPVDGGGYSACYGMPGQEAAILISDMKGGWHQHFSGMQNSGYQLYDTTFSSFPMIEPKVGGFCTTLFGWRDDKAQWFLREACDPVTNRPRFLNERDEKSGSLVKSYSTGAHSVQPRKLTEAEIKAQIQRARYQESGLHDLPTYVAGREQLKQGGNASLDDGEETSTISKAAFGLLSPRSR